MKREYVDLIDSFRSLKDEDKKEEILKDINELLSLLYTTNKSYDYSNEALPILKNYSDDSEYLDALYSSIISLKEETAKLIEKEL